MKIIFLDIDGVLNFHKTLWRWDYTKKEPYKAEPGEREGGFYGIDPSRVALILMIVEKTGAKLVLSSTWRLDKDWQETMEKNGLKKDLFLGRTDEILSAPYRTQRGHEVDEWLKSCGLVIKKYAIIDDNDDFLDHQKEHFFKTGMMEGLTESHAFKIIEHLNKGEL